MIFCAIMLVVLVYILILWGWCKAILRERTTHLLVKCTALFAVYLVLFFLLCSVFLFPIEFPTLAVLVMMALGVPVVFALIHYFGASIQRALVIVALTSVSWIFLSLAPSLGSILVMR